MEKNGGLAEELYGESLRLAGLQLDSAPTNNYHDEGDLPDGDGSFWGDSDEENLDNSSELDREWKRRHDEFHTMGYRDGIIAGKEGSAQEGFNAGFKQSFHTGYNWGHVRGVTSVVACLPDELKEMLIKTQENRAKFLELHESVHALSTTDALRMFHSNIETTNSIPGMQEHPDGSSLDCHIRKLQSLLLETPAIHSSTSRTS